MDENNVKISANFCVEAMNSKREVKGKLGLTWYKFTFAVSPRRANFKSL